MDFNLRFRRDTLGWCDCFDLGLDDVEKQSVRLPRRCGRGAWAGFCLLLNSSASSPRLI